MDLDVTFRNLNARPEIRERGVALYRKLERFLDPAAEGHLLVSIDHDDAVCEVVVKTRGHVFKAEEVDGDLRTAMDKVFHNIEEQLRRFKGKRTQKKARGRDPESGFVPVDGAVVDEEEDDEDGLAAAEL